MVLYRYYSGNMWMRVVVHQFEVFELEVIDTLHIRINFHLRQCAWFAAKLQFDLIQVVQIDMGNAKCMDNSPAFSPVTCAIICSSSAYDAILNGTPRNISALRW